MAAVLANCYCFLNMVIGKGAFFDHSNQESPGAGGGGAGVGEEEPLKLWSLEIKDLHSKTLL